MKAVIPIAIGIMAVLIISGCTNIGIQKGEFTEDNIHILSLENGIEFSPYSKWTKDTWNDFTCELCTTGKAYDIS